MKHSGDRQSIYKDLYLFARDLAGFFGWYLSYILDLYGILFQEKNYVSYKELGEASYLDFSFLKMPVCIPAGFHDWANSQAHWCSLNAFYFWYLMNSLLWGWKMLFVSENAARLFTFQQVHFDSFVVKSWFGVGLHNFIVSFSQPSR